MAVGLCWAVALVGLHGHLVRVEADVAEGLPTFALVGLPDAALTEARDRVRAALANSRLALPSRRITVNLSPAALPKTGSGFDLAIVTALLAARGAVEAASVADRVHIGEVGLDGTIRPVRGALPAALAAVRAGRTRLVVAQGNEAEVLLVPGAEVVAVRSVEDLVAVHTGAERPEDGLGLGGWGAEAGFDQVDPEARPSPPHAARGVPASGDLGEVLGQVHARAALEVAAAGGHHLLMLGPPGAGKTMLASRLPSLLPDLPDEAAMEVTALHSVAGTLDPAAGLMRRPPYEAPHHTTSRVALVGGGSGLARPGAVSLAHRGVLFLDEAAEFESRSLDALRQPLEQGEVVLHRALGSATYPARFQLVLATNPCPCGRWSGRGDDCTCTALARRRYLGRLSGPLLDRVDLQIEVLAVSRADLLAVGPAEPSCVVRGRVEAAREAQLERLALTPWRCNGEVPGAWLRGALRLPTTHTRGLDRLLDRGEFTLRGYDRVLRVAWTMADLAGRDAPSAGDVDEAISMRRHARVAA